MPRVITYAVAVLALAACDAKENARAIPTGPAVSAAAAPAGSGAASVCTAYRATETRVRADLAKQPNDPTLKDQAQAIGAIIADACH